MPARGAQRVGCWAESHGSWWRHRSDWWAASGGGWAESDGSPWNGTPWRTTPAARWRRVRVRKRKWRKGPNAVVVHGIVEWLRIMSFIIYHEFPWTPRRHFGRCAMNCGCCRVELIVVSSPEDCEGMGVCEVCYDGWTLTTVSRAFRDMTQKYAREQLHLDQVVVGRRLVVGRLE